MLGSIRTLLERWRNYKRRLKEKNRWAHFFVDTTEAVIVALFLALLIRKYIIQTSVVPTASMVPTLNVKDRLFVNKYIYRFTVPERGDIIVFKSPYNDGKDYVKRCIGLPGETVEMRDGVVYVNGERLILPGATILRDYADMPMTRVPEGHYFALGDNRGNSQDSRVWGFVPKEELLGKALFTFLPLSRMRLLH